MTDNELHSVRSSWAEFLRALRRARALMAWVEVEPRRRFWLTTARVYAFGVLLTYAVGMLLARGPERGAAIHSCLRAALVALSLGVGAPAALGAARILAQQAERGALLAVAVQRGHSKRALATARVWAVAAHIARLVLVPALALVLLGLARGARVTWAVAVAPAVAVYAGLLGAGLAFVAGLSAELSPRHPRCALAALVLVPWLMSQAYPSVPNVAAFYSALLGRLLQPGVTLS